MRFAFVAVALSFLSGALSSAAIGQSQIPEEKDPAVALGFAWLCPGCGHLYSGETTKGAVIGALSIGSLAGGIAIQLTRSAREMARFSEAGALYVDHPDLTPFLVGAAISLASYTYGLIDAGPSVRRANARRAMGSRRLDLRPAVAADGSVGARLTLRFGGGA